MPERGIRAEHLSVGYGRDDVVSDLDLSIPEGRVTAIIGANACGKSTLLRALARLMKPSTGTVLLDGRDIHAEPTRRVAERLGILPQAPGAPEGISVVDLVSRGRYPHRSVWRSWTPEDDRAVAEAMVLTGTLDLAERPVDELSGGQRQRVWIAMTLAQGAGVMLLDEPTTYLDLAHQVEVLDLLADLNRVEGRTIVLVLHDLNQAARYADHLVAMRDGAVHAEGVPADIVDEQLVLDVFGLRASVVPDPVTGTPMVVPHGRRRAGFASSA